MVYQGHHGDVGASYADIILPGAAYTEKDGTYVNTEGRVQKSRAAVPPPAGAREDWKILRALSEVAGVPLPYDRVQDLKHRINEIAPHLSGGSSMAHPSVLSEYVFAAQESGPSTAADAPFALPISDFYLTDSISRSSPTMAKCSASFTTKA